MRTARNDVPRKRLIATAAIVRSVRTAFCACGGLKAVTPLEIDSTPVSAAEPEANAFRSTKRVSVPVPTGSGWGVIACGQLPTVHLTTPTESAA